MYKSLLAALLAATVLLGGCASQSPGQTTAFTSGQNPVCTVGQKVPYDNMTFHLEFNVYEDTFAVRKIVNGSTDPGSYGNELHALGNRDGRNNRFKGQGHLTVYMNVDASHFPTRNVSYLNGADVCAGTVPVVSDGPGYTKFTLPVRGGGGLGQAILVPPLAPLKARDSLEICVQADDFSLAYLPELAAGRYKGRKNMLCGRSRTLTQPSYVTQWIQQKKRGIMYPLIHGED